MVPARREAAPLETSFSLTEPDRTGRLTARAGAIFRGPLTLAGRRPQAAPASCAARTAALASAAPQSATRPSSSPLAGSCTGKKAGVSSQRPPTRPPRRTRAAGNPQLPRRAAGAGG